MKWHFAPLKVWPCGSWEESIGAHWKTLQIHPDSFDHLRKVLTPTSDGAESDTPRKEN